MSQSSKVVSAALLEQAAQALVAGDLVAFPTETVYGLGADAENAEAIAKIYAAKGRPANHPLIVHVAPGADLYYWAQSIPVEAWRLVEAFWPGPLTLILPRAAHIPTVVTGGQDTIGIRCPSHPVAQALLQAFARLKGGQGGVAAPSANLFGQVSPTQAEHVHSEFAGQALAPRYVLDGGAAIVGIESTIVDVSRAAEGEIAVLRPGHISVRQVEEVLSRPVSVGAAKPNTPRVSGSLKAHYAPKTPLYLCTPEQLAARYTQANEQAYAVLGFGTAPVELPAAATWVSMPVEAESYAQALYALLRRLDQDGFEALYVQEVPDEDAWRGVQDRISRAAAAFE